jgi:D-alanyl-D-alanine endopeptidase (penicillin-binding protein 7)
MRNSLLLCAALTVAASTLCAAAPKKVPVSQQKPLKNPINISKKTDAIQPGKKRLATIHAKKISTTFRQKINKQQRFHPPQLAKKRKDNIVDKRAKVSIQREIVSKAIAQARRQAKVQQVSAIESTLYAPGIQSMGALVINEHSGQIIYEKNARHIVPIASITKVMTAMVVLDAHLPMNELLTITEEDVDRLKKTNSRLTIGTKLTRAEMLLLALMSSENRAASALSRHYPGGQAAFVRAMNQKARDLGMQHTHFNDATGLNSGNVSTAHDLSLMVSAAHRYPEIHQFSTSMHYTFVSNVTGTELAFRNTNPLTHSNDWNIGVSKTGYISEAGKCLVMQALINNAPVVIVLLASSGKHTRVIDAQRIKRWMETDPNALLNAG